MGTKRHDLLTGEEPTGNAAAKPRRGSRPRAGNADRTFVDAAVTVSVDQAGVRGIACDVSEHGMKIKLDSPLEPGPVSVKLVGLPTVSGEICWSMARHVGVRLMRPFSPDVLADWIRHHGTRR
jgi:hypothetical protein